MSTSPTAIAEWHQARRRQIRRRHPEVKALIGRDRSSGFYIIALSLMQILAAMGMAGRPLPVVFGAALLLGTIPAHGLGVLIHEAAHNLVTKGDRANKLWAIVANLTLIGPDAINFRYLHILHHRHLGDRALDPQAPPVSEIRAVGAHPGRKLLSFTFGRFVFSDPEQPRTPVDRWLVANWVACIGTGAAVVAVLGGSAFAYLAFSGLLAFGPSVVGARRISEHVPVLEDQPTNSYYGLLNVVSFNVGHHVEHHDFPSISWRRLPALRRLAPEAYDPLFAFRSWTVLIVRYFTSARYEAGHYLGRSPALPRDEAALLMRFSRPAELVTEYDASPPSHDGSAPA